MRRRSIAGELLEISRRDDFSRFLRDSIFFHDGQHADYFRYRRDTPRSRWHRQRWAFSRDCGADFGCVSHALTETLPMLRAPIRSPHSFRHVTAARRRAQWHASISLRFSCHTGILCARGRLFRLGLLLYSLCRVALRRRRRLPRKAPAHAAGVNKPRLFSRRWH